MQLLIRNILFSILMLSAFTLEAQDTLVFDNMSVVGKKSIFKKVGLYDGADVEEYNIRGFTQTTIFNGSLGDFWTSDGSNCITGKIVSDETSQSLRVKWDQGGSNCDWVGMGFGWDSWSGKDLGYVADTLALEMTVRSVDKPFTNIPWALCLEDYSGGQAWVGFNKSFLSEKSITKEWNKVTIPLQLFPYEDFDVDLSNIKQFMVQMFGSGELEIKSIELIPFAEKLKNEFIANESAEKISVDGNLKDWEGSLTQFGDSHSFAVNHSPDSLYFAFNIIDDTPRQNKGTKENLWKGDAIEIAFSTNPSANPKRSFLLMSDQHIGINCGEDSYVWNWKSNSIIDGANYTITSTKDGYTLELAIPTNAFYKFQPKSGFKLDMEIAVDLGTLEGRKEQIRWNSGHEPGFHKSPKKWGALILN
ncbi:MAG: sugar-binding protein [Crocinitomicaceae bacterium]|nr:sugar-binding protein [Crocinitomicaceae bacterium]MDG1658258.1 sugar-binding protein [Crocinitomicaceae bacterium]MDG2441364.1 sugar-binding protein [Crocinitomicaceae bacterium]